MNDDFDRELEEFLDHEAWIAAARFIEVDRTSVSKPMLPQMMGDFRMFWREPGDDSAR